MSRARPDIFSELRKWVPKNCSVLVALSGGADSVCLLHATKQLEAEFHLKILAAHVDHGVRKESSDDAQFCRQLCEQLAVPFFETKLGSLPKGENFEAWARGQRYAFFAKLRQSEGIDWILTAHHADDIAETFLMRLIANKELKTILRQDSPRRLIRPLLSIRKRELVDYLEQNSQSWVEDSSNADQTLLRNRVRHRLLPQLEEFDPRIAEVLSIRAQALAADIEALEELARAVLTGLSPEEERTLDNTWSSKLWVRSLCKELESLPLELQWRVIEQSLLSEFGFGIGRAKSLEVVEMLSSATVAVQLPGKGELRRKDSAFQLKLR